VLEPRPRAVDRLVALLEPSLGRRDLHLADQLVAVVRLAVLDRPARVPVGVRQALLAPALGCFPLVQRLALPGIGLHDRRLHDAGIHDLPAPRDEAVRLPEVPQRARVRNVQRPLQPAEPLEAQPVEHLVLALLV
jgi:hypothetical protein